MRCTVRLDRWSGRNRRRRYRLYFGILLHLHRPVQYIIAMLIAAAVAFVLSWLFGLEPEQIQPQTAPAAPQQSSESTPAVEAAPKAAEIANDLTITAPLAGNAVSLTETGDETFAQEVLGPGIAIEPTVGKVVAPCDATITHRWVTQLACPATTAQSCSSMSVWTR